MNFAEVLTKNFLFTWQGRVNRQRYWAFYLVYLAGLVISLIVDALLTGGLLYFLYLLAVFYPSLCIGIKRWHDRDKSGWWTLILLIPVIGLIWGIIELGFLKGTEGPNRFGPDPLGGA